MPPASDTLCVAPPRLCHYPSYSYSSGVEAVELAASAGLILDPWQAYVLEHGLGETADGKWSAFQVALIVARQNGKGAIFEALELAALFLFGDMLIGHSAHEYKTAMEAFRRILSLITNTDDLRRQVKKVVNTNGEEGIELLTGQRLRFMARSKGAGRGFSFDRLIWDEAYALSNTQVDAQLPTLSARPNPQVWYGSSPPLDSVTGEQLFRLRRLIMDGGFPPDLAFFDYGAAGSLDDLSGIDLSDRDLWRGTNPAYPNRITEETVAREHASMGPVGFARERLCIWPPDLSAGYAVINAEDWAAARDATSGMDGGVQLAGRPAFAVDVSPDRSRASIALACRRADGRTHVEVVAADPGTGWVIPRLVQLRDRWKPCAIVIDPGGPAGSLIADAAAAGLEVVTTGARDVAQAYGQFWDGICSADDTARVIRHLGQSELDVAVAGAARRQIGDGHAWDRRAATVDLTPLVAVTNAGWGLAVHGHVQAPEPWVMYA